MDNQQGNLQWYESIMDQYVEPVAYSIGALLGDGSVKTFICSRGPNLGFQKQRTVRISNMDYECIERVKNEINGFFGSDYKVQAYKNPNNTEMFGLFIGGWEIYKFFHYFIGEKLMLPDEVFRAKKSARLAFLAGLFDTDGYIAASPNSGSKSGVSWRIGYAARYRTLVEDVARLMQKLGVKVGQIYEQDSEYNTRMYVIKPNIRSFLDAGCYFHIKRKINRLADYVKHTRYQRYVKPSETIMLNP